MQASATLASARHKQALLEIAEQKLRETKVRVPAPTLDQALAIGWRGEGGLRAERLEDRVRRRGEVRVRGERWSAHSPRLRRSGLVVDRVLEVRATVPERYAGRIRTGQSVAIHARVPPRRNPSPARSPG
jgi:hypothetical protein